MIQLFNNLHFFFYYDMVFTIFGDDPATAYRTTVNQTDTLSNGLS